jgi:DNA-binding FrmR family transcriptional regulator
MRSEVGAHRLNGDSEAALAVVTRLRKIEGQIRGIQHMIAEGRPCEEVVRQIAAAKAALGKAGTHFIALHLSQCLGTAEQETKARLDQALEMFASLA